MAIYRYAQYLSQSNHNAYDLLHKPGTPAPHSGIYRCEACGVNEVSTHGHSLPPQNHHQHNPVSPIQWRLIVATK